MPYEYNKNLSKNSRFLRKGMTPEEKHLWYDFLCHLPVTVNRQKIIGNYIVDFYIHSSKIVIELDGIQHEIEEQKKADNERDEFLSGLGLTVLRYTNTVINKRFKFVCGVILEHLGLSLDDIKNQNNFKHSYTSRLK